MIWRACRCFLLIFWGLGETWGDHERPKHRNNSLSKPLCCKNSLSDLSGSGWCHLDAGINWRGKRVVIAGMGAFAVENVHGAQKNDQIPDIFDTLNYRSIQKLASQLRLLAIFALAECSLFL